MKNKAGIKEMDHHIKVVKGARAVLKKEATSLKSDIDKKITGALKQDHKVLKDMKRADKKSRK